MFELVGVLFALSALFVVSLALGVLFALVVCAVFWGRRKPKGWISAAFLIPPLSAAYVVCAAILLAIFVPNQPDEFFGDFREPLPHGYVLTGLGKMPDWAYIDSPGNPRNQPQMAGTVSKLEEEGEMVYGAYSHWQGRWDTVPQAGEPAYFAFDTRNGVVKDIQTVQQLNEFAGRTVHLQESQFFRSPLPGRNLLRRVESGVYFGPPATAALVGFFFILRVRFKRKETD